jgi:hypothetical protein
VCVCVWERCWEKTEGETENAPAQGGSHVQVLPAYTPLSEQQRFPVQLAKVVKGGAAADRAVAMTNNAIPGQ